MRFAALVVFWLASFAASAHDVAPDTVVYVFKPVSGANISGTDYATLAQQYCENKHPSPAPTYTPPSSLVFALFGGSLGSGCGMGLATNCAATFSNSGGTCSPGGQNITIARTTFTCPADHAYDAVAGTCGHFVSSDCGDVAGRAFDFDSLPYGSGFSVPGSLDQATANVSAKNMQGSFICENGCKAKVASVGCRVYTNATGGQNIACSGTGLYVTPATFCTPSPTQFAVTRLGVAKNAPTTASSAGVSGGGDGTVGGGNGVDSINTAKIATNTSRIADSVAGLAGAGSTSSSSASVNMCGSDGQPACVIDEGDTAASNAGMGTSIAATKAAAETGYQANATALGGAAPTLLPGTGRWLLNVSSLLPTASCVLEAGVLHVGSVTIPLSMSVCAYGAHVRAFLYYLFGLLTLGAIWAILFRGN